jgi:hypothetical protein
MIGRLLEDGDIRKLQQAITLEKPASPTIRGKRSSARPASAQA